MEKLRLYIFAFLAFCVFSSKNIIIYNEETLVALSFLSFIFFISHYFGNTIKESLNERSNAIKLELHNLGLGRQDSLLTLLTEYQKLSDLNTALNDVSAFTGRELTIATLQGEKALNSLYSQQMQQKLKTLSQSKITIQQKLQSFMAANLLGNVHVHFQRSKKQNKYNPFDRQLIQSAIQMLSVNK